MPHARKASPPTRWQRWQYWLADLPLATKTAGLVGITGTLSALIAITAMLVWQQVDRSYQKRLIQETQNALQLGAVSVQLSDASREVLAVLAAQEHFDMQQTRQQLLQIQMDLRQELSAIAQRAPELTLETAFIEQRSQRLFLLGHEVVDATLRWRGDLALLLIERNFAPAMQALRFDIEQLQHHAQQAHNALVRAQARARQEAVVLTLIAVVLAIFAVSALSAWLAVHWVSRPIAHMTQYMERLIHRDYQLPLGGAERHDEVGTMANALQVFRDNMLRNEQLALQVAHAHASTLLSEQLLELTRALPAGIFQLHIDSAGHSELRFVTPQWEAAVRHTLTPYRYPALWQLLRKSSHTLAAIDCDLQCVLHTGQPPVWLKVLAAAKRTATGGTLFHGGLIDISQEKAQAQALQLAKHAADTAAQCQARFLATISHEIRTPLNAILGMTQLLLRNPLPAPQQRQIENVHRAGRHLRSLANDVLDFSKMEAQHMALEHTDFSLPQLVHDVMAMCQEEAEHKGLQLDCRLDPGLPTWLRGDPFRLTQALLNLAHNAIKFTAHGHVRIRVLARSAPVDTALHVEFAVSDTGPGLSRAESAHLFQPFHQLDASITRRFGGTGLGLAIVQRLAHLMQGAVGVRSRPGWGSRFWLTAQLEVAPAPSPVLAPATHALAPARVLLVDDHPVNLEVLDGFLTAAGMCTHHCSDGQAAWEHLQSLPPDHYQAVLLDLQMPRLDGWSTCRRLRADPRYRLLPVLAMTAHTSLEDLRQCKEAGMDGHLAKPVLETALWHALERVLPHSNPLPAPTPAGPTVTLPPVPRSHPDFSPSAMEALAACLPASKVVALGQRFSLDLHERLDLLRLACSANDLPQLHQLAHQIAGTAETFGLMHLGALTTELARAPSAPAARSTVDEILRSAEAGMAQLQHALQAVDAAAST